MWPPPSGSLHVPKPEDTTVVGRTFAISQKEQTGSLPVLPAQAATETSKQASSRPKSQPTSYHSTLIRVTEGVYLLLLDKKQPPLGTHKLLTSNWLGVHIS